MMNSEDPDFEVPHRGIYFPNWAQYRPGAAKFTANDVDASMCTYLIVAFAKIENNQLQPFEWNDLETFKILVNLKKKNPRLKILLAVGGWTLSNQVAALAASPDALRTFIASAVTNLRKWGLDGLDIDWEFPAEENKEQFSAMLKGIRIGFESEKRPSNQQRLALTTAVHLLSLGGYDAKVISRTCDVVNIMTYDLHGAWDPNTIGHHAPLYKGPFGEDSSKNLADVVKSWETAGLAKNKIAVGIPFYGRGWNVSQSSECKLGGRADGPISASRSSGETGNWPYHEIVERIKASGDKPVYDQVIKSTCLTGKNFWIGYDDVLSVKGKAAWVKANHYGGVFAWEMSQDDFSGAGGVGKFPLIRAIYEVLTGRDSVPAPREITGTGTAGNTQVDGSKFHTVKPGDTAYNIALQYGMTLDQLQKLNLTKKNLEMIHPGDKIAVDSQQGQPTSSESVRPTGSSQSSTDSSATIHVVQAGDTAYNIAMKNGMTLDQLRKMNPGRGTMEMIHPGDKIVIGGGATGLTVQGSVAGTHSIGKFHTVQSGDTAYNIALKNGMTLDQLRKLNPGKGTMEMIHPGDRIAIG